MSLKYLKEKSFYVLLILLTYSCAVYQMEPVSLAEAAATNKRILIIRNDDTKLKLKKVEQLDGQYFGIYKLNGENVKTPLLKEDIKTIRILDENVTALGNSGIVIISALGIALGILAITL